MYIASFSPRFERDVKSCTKKHWNTAALKSAITDLLNSDSHALDRRYKDHVLVGKWQGYRSIHVDSAPNPAKDQWVLMYKIHDHELVFVRTGTHEEVYGK